MKTNEAQNTKFIWARQNSACFQNRFLVLGSYGTKTHGQCCLRSEVKWKRTDDKSRQTQLYTPSSKMPSASQHVNSLTLCLILDMSPGTGAIPAQGSPKTFR